MVDGASLELGQAASGSSVVAGASALSDWHHDRLEMTTAVVSKRAKSLGVARSGT